MTALHDYRIKTHLAPVRLLDFAGSQAAANWVDVTSTGTPSITDAPEYALGSTNAIKIAQGSASGTLLARYRFYNASGWNCSGSDMFTIAVEYPEGILPSRQRVGSNGTLEITFSSDGDGTFTNNALFILGGGGAFCGVPEKGRNVWTFHRSDATSTGGTINWSAVTNIRLRLSTASATDELVIQGLWCGRRPHPVVCVTADDGWATQGLGANEMCTIANSYGVPMTLYVIPDLSDDSDGTTYLSEAEIAAIAAAGNSIAVHGTGPAGEGDLTDYTDWGLEHIASQQAWVQERGYDYKHYCYPGGAFSDEVIANLQSLGILTGRTLSGQSYTYQTWAANTAYAVGTYRVPTTPNGFRYSVDSVSGTGTSHPTTEPAWPTTLGATIVDNAGPDAITWKCRNFQTASRGSYYCFTPHVNAMPNWYSMNACPLNNQLTVSEVLTEVDRAIKKGEGIILYGHKLGGAADSLTFVTADFTTLCEALKLRQDQGLCDVMTVPQMYKAYGDNARTAAATRPDASR